jgi:gluconate 5-dehydrogenase
MAQALAEAGADLVLVGRDSQSLEQARQELRALGHAVDILAADLESPEATQEMCRRALAEYDPIHILINNVGGRRINVPVEEMDVADWRRLLDLNLTSAFVCTREIGGDMLARQWGRVINVASISAAVAMRGIHGRHYETAKAALVGFTRTLAADWAPRGVTVNAIAPGAFLTDPNRRWFREKPGFREQVEALIPMGRLGQAEELGPLAVYLASDASSYMTGAMLVVDGGYTLW